MASDPAPIATAPLAAAPPALPTATESSPDALASGPHAMALIPTANGLSAMGGAGSMSQAYPACAGDGMNKAQGAIIDAANTAFFRVILDRIENMASSPQNRMG